MYDCFSHFTKTELIEDVECSNCAKKYNLPSKLARFPSNRCMRLARPPQVLCIHLNRRHYDPRYQQCVKIHRHVSCPLNFNAYQFCAFDVQKGKTQLDSVQALFQYQFPKSNVLKNKKSLQYKLRSLIVHQGSSEFGHYVCFRRMRNNEWLFISDSFVRQANISEVQSAQVCMAFYERAM